MLNESGIARRYLSTQKKRTVLLTMGVALAMALISTVFSMLNLMQAFEVRMTIEDSGVWEVMAGACTPAQAAALQKRVDVSASGKVAVVTQDAQIGGTDLQSLTGADAGGFTQRHWLLKSGKLPRGTGEIALEGWALQKLSPGAKIGDTLILTIAGKKQSYTVSGILRDNAVHRDSKLYKAWISLGEAQQLNGSDDADVLMQVAGNADIGKFVKSVESEQHLSKDQMQTHGTLLAATGRSDSREVIAIYAVGAVLGLVVLFAAIVMIYNAFNMSVTQRMRQFGLLRAIGATPKQVRRMVRAEAAQVSLLGVLPGVALGAVVSMLLNLLLRSTFPAYFGGPDAPVVFISWPSLAIGAIVGILGTLLSALRPARRAGKVSPVEAIAAMPGANFKKRKTMGVATHLLPVEAAIALRQVLMRKRAFLLTAVSLAFGILLLLAFSPVTDFFAQGTRHTYDLGDVYALTTTPGQGFSDETVRDMSKIDGVQSISPKRIGSVDATFAYSLLGENYQDGVKNGGAKASKGADGMVKTDAKSKILGLSDTDIRALQSDLILGKIDPAQLDKENGVLLMINEGLPGQPNLGDLQPGTSSA
ncbi:ABC transporter permease [Ethanoligenens harbinense]|uniref:ABC transporter permease n=1 Tax=Ethanoligenens harbinense TaxID=253239 RepID=UPI000EA37694|nr:FtsX-like permease family protein [Ethanoligenens harbinense]AYF41123.1 hypothetical protein CN246_05365 [Ethanoligenens harbinense]